MYWLFDGFIPVYCGCRNVSNPQTSSWVVSGLPLHGRTILYISLLFLLIKSDSQLPSNRPEFLFISEGSRLGEDWRSTLLNQVFQKLHNWWEGCDFKTNFAMWATILVTVTRPFAQCYLKLTRMSTDNIDFYPLELDLELHQDHQERLDASKTKIQELLPAAWKNILIAVVRPVRIKSGTEGNPIIID